MNTIYLDYAASTPMDPRVADEIDVHNRNSYGNASSLHKIGLNAKAILDNTRELIANELKCNADEVIFTSGGTEADNLAISGVAAQVEKPGEIITSTAEHPAVKQTCDFLKKQGWQISALPLNANGIVEPQQLQYAISEKTTLISIMHVNNEIGTINPINELAAIAHQHGIPFHTDAVQSFGKLPIDMQANPISMLSFTGHKIYGPRGAGVLVVKRKVKLHRIQHGGSQEKKLRAGTENISAIAGLRKAVELMHIEYERDAALAKSLSSTFIKHLKAAFPEVHINGGDMRIPNIINFSLPQQESMPMLMGLDLLGICASNGSACSSGNVTPSHVLQALKLPSQLQKSALRFSFGRFTTAQEIELALSGLIQVAQNRRS